MDETLSARNRFAFAASYTGWAIGAILIGVGLPMAWSLGNLLMPLGLLLIGWVTLRTRQRRIVGLLAIVLGIALGAAIIRVIETPSSTSGIQRFERVN